MRVFIIHQQVMHSSSSKLAIPVRIDLKANSRKQKLKPIMLSQNLKLQQGVLMSTKQPQPRNQNNPLQKYMYNIEATLSCFSQISSLFSIFFHHPWLISLEDKGFDSSTTNSAYKELDKILHSCLHWNAAFLNATVKEFIACYLSHLN